RSARPVSAPIGDLVILEVADIRIEKGSNAEFEAAVARGVDAVLSSARGFAGYKLNRGIESPERYLLMIFWQTLENHTVDFRESDAFAAWRAIVGGFFAAAPAVEHFE